MSALACRPGKSALALTFAAVLTAALSDGAAAQSEAHLYALNSKGQTTVNGSVLDVLSGSKWVGLVVDGSDRYALRDDGRVDMNGIKQYSIKCKDGNNNDVNEGLWVDLAERDGSIWALSAKGYLAKDGVCAAKFDEGDYTFVKLFSGTTAGTENTWALRSDGACYANTITGAIFNFDGGDGLDPELGEGDAQDTMWWSGAVKPSNGVIYAMRRDGVVVAGTFAGGDGTPFSGTMVAALPFVATANSSTLYADLAFTMDDKWNAIRGNGQLYTEDNQLTAFIEFNNSGKTFVDLLPLPANKSTTTTDMSVFALRADGNLFRETQESSVFSLPKSGYGELALSFMPPDLTNHKNALPVVTTYAVQAVTGTPFSFPILATDTDKPEADLVITVDAETLPDGAVYDDMARTISWDDPVKGKSKIKVEVDDGEGKVVKKTFSVVVRDPPANPDKNAKPRFSKIKGTQALVGKELVLPILASDQNGDELTISVDESVPPFTLGATFDPMTNIFSWDDSELSDIGTYKMQFMVTDGIATAKLKVQVKLVASLLGF